MSKIGLIIEREYLTRVRKKSFFIMTLLVPLLMVGFYAAILAISMSDTTDQQKIAVLDEGNLLSDTLNGKTIGAIQYEIIKGETEAAFVKKYKQKGFDNFLYIPQQDINNPKGFKIHSPSSTNLNTTRAVESLIEDALVAKRLDAQGIDRDSYKNISANVSVANAVDTKDGEKKNAVWISMIISVVCGMLIYLMMIIYGAQVMRGVTEEKTNRIAEVVVSSVKPFDLMMGKILGIGAVGLTQFLIWMVLIILLQAVLPMFIDIPVATTGLAGEAIQNENIAATVTQGLDALPLVKILFCFLFYFLGGYLTYASLFAAVGSVVSEDQQEAQQMMFPILMPIILGFVIMMQAIQEPNSSLAVFGSIFPLTSPVVMMGRITSDVPWWQLASSMVLLILCFLAFTWVTAKIYRTGILMYGKKPSWKEMMKWGFRKGS